MTIAQALALFLQSIRGLLSPATVGWYTHRLAPLTAALGRRQVSTITLDDLRAWRATLSERRMSPWTLHAHVRAARRLFKWLVEDGKLEKSPAARLELPPLPLDPARGIASADMAKMIRAAKASPRDYALCLFLADTAARVGGVAGLKVEELDLVTGRVLVREKGSKARAVYFTGRTGRALRVYLGGRKSGPVFLGCRGRAEPLKAGGIYQVLKRLARRAGVLRKFNPHAWRHGVARRWLQERGANLGVVSQLLGHSDVSVTSRFYGAFVDEELRQAHRRYTVVRDDDD